MIYSSLLQSWYITRFFFHIEEEAGMISSMGHAFSVEMKSKQYIKNISISNESQDKVLFEGSLGDLLDMSLEEERVLEFIGTNGVLRIAVTRLQLEKTLAKGNSTGIKEGKV